MACRWVLEFGLVSEGSRGDSRGLYGTLYLVIVVDTGRIYLYKLYIVQGFAPHGFAPIRVSLGRLEKEFRRADPDVDRAGG